MTFVDRLLNTYPQLMAGLSRSITFITPRFATSRHLVALVESDSGALVCKIARDPRDREGLQREAAALDLAASHVKGAVDVVPQVLWQGDFEGRAVLVESMLIGRELDPSSVHHDPDSAFTALVRLVDSFEPLHNPHRDWFRSVDTALVRLELWRGGLLADDVRQVRRRVRRLENIAAPVMFVHADMSHPNLIHRSDGTVGLVDWERSGPGVVLQDLVFALQYWAESVDHAFDLSSQIAAFDRLWQPGSAARDVACNHLAARGVPDEDVEAWVILAWAMTVASLPLRIGDSSALSDEHICSMRDVQLLARSLETCS